MAEPPVRIYEPHPSHYDQTSAEEENVRIYIPK